MKKLQHKCKVNSIAPVELMDNFVDSHCGGQLEGWTKSFLRKWSEFFASTEAKGGIILLQRIASMKQNASVWILDIEYNEEATAQV
jgi:hypothetical protein